MQNTFIRYLACCVALLFGATVLGQTITGTITSEGEPLIGASVLVKGTSSGAVTDFDGVFTVDDVPADAILIFSYTGFASQEVPVNGRAVFDIELLIDASSLQEVVVVAYGTANRKDLTGAVAVIGSDELNVFPATTVDQALQGKTPGVQITQNSGAPGASVSVNIRGVGSFGSTTPLYVIDGFPTNDISLINPNSIESITILKDASATALYGVRASNGVVIVETKKGVSQGIEVEVNSFIGTRTKPNTIDVLNATQFAGFATELSGSSNDDVAGNAVPYEGWSNPGSLRNVNWQDEVFSAAPTRSVSVAVRGGGERGRIAFTAGVFDEEGTLIGSKYKRYDAGFNSSFDLNDRVRLIANTKYVSSQSFQPLGSGRGSLLNLFATVPHLAPAGEANLRGGTNPTDLPVDADGNFGAFPDVVGEAFRDGRNWVARATENDQDNITNNVLANVGLEWDIVDGLSTRVNFGARFDNFAGWNFQPKYYRSSGNVDVRDNAVYSYTQSGNNQWVAEYLLNYKQTFADVHRVDLLGGVSAQRSFNKFTQIQGVGFLNNNIRDISQAAGIQSASGFSTRQTLASTFGRFNYSFDGRYYLTATLRRDGVGDTFGPENLWGVFPSFALGWNIDEEEFMRSSIFNTLKLRGSWGETGNFNGINPFLFSTTFNNGTPRNDASYSFGGQNALGLAPVGASNPNLKWEAQIQTNIGIEGSLADNKIYFTIDYFNRESSDFLFFINSTSQSGFVNRPANAGTVVNNGLEFLLGYRKNQGDFTFDINANITTLSNEITALNTPSNQVTFSNEFLNSFNEAGFWYDITRSSLGGEVGSFYGFVSDGIFQNQGEIDEANAGSDNGFYQSEETSPGDRRFKDLDGDGRITGTDRQVIGSPVPDFYGSLNILLSYQNFDLGLNFYGSYGNEIFNLVRRELESASGYGNSASFSNVSTEYFNNRWNGDGSTDTYVRALINDGDVQNNRASDYFVEDGSYFRLRNASLGYTIPSSITSRVGIEALRFYASAQNLFTLTNYTGSDPEIGQNSDINGNSNVTTRGIDAGAYPVSKLITFGLNLKF